MLTQYISGLNLTNFIN